MINEQTNEQKFTVYGRNECSYTQASLRTLRKLFPLLKSNDTGEHRDDEDLFSSDEQVAYIQINNAQDIINGLDVKIKKRYPKLENHQTVPVIFYKRMFVGGNQELQDLINKEEGDET